MKRVISFGLVLILLISIAFPAGAVHAVDEAERQAAGQELHGLTEAASDGAVDVLPGGGTAKEVTALLKPFEVVIYQEGKAVDPNAPIDVTKPIDVNIKFRVPVKKDFPEGTPNTNYVIKGDFAKIAITDDIKLEGEQVTDMMGPEYKGIRRKVGSVKLATKKDGSNTVYAEIRFDGEDVVFDELEQVEVQILASFKKGAFWAEEITESKKITILDKIFDLTIPDNIGAALNKTAVYNLDQRRVEWTAVIDAGVAIPLSGFQVKDTLKALGGQEPKRAAGEYIAGSLSATNGKGQPLAITDLTLENGVLSFTLPEDSLSPVTIQYHTAVTPEEAYRTHWHEIKRENRIDLYDKKGIKRATASAYVILKRPDWINKHAWSSQDGRIIWSMPINYEGVTLENIEVKDILPAGLEFEKAEWYDYTSRDINTMPQIGQTITVKPADDIYRLDRIDRTMMLRIATRVKRDELPQGQIRKEFHNTAWLKFKDLPDNIELKATTTIHGGYTDGIGGVEKRFLGREPGTANLRWEIMTGSKRIDKIAQPRIYDLMIHDRRLPVNNEWIGQGLVIEGGPAGLSFDTLKLLNQSYLHYQGYESVTEGLEVVTYPVTRNGKKVGDLVEVRPIAGNDSWKGKDWRVVLKAETTFRQYALNDDKKGYWVANTATLTDGNRLVDKVFTSSQYQTRQIEKEMLPAQAQEELKQKKDAETANRIEADVTGGYNYKTNSVIFRLSINGDNHQHLKNALGALKLTDTLPKGWVFTNITDDSPYLIFRGEPIQKEYLGLSNEPGEYKIYYNNLTRANASVKAVGNPLSLADIPGLSVNDFIGGQQAEFSFGENLTAPYVILLEAKPSAEQLQKYLEGKEVADITNEAIWGGQLLAEDGLEELSFHGLKRSQRVKFSAEVLKKKPKAHDSTIDWMIEYNPHNLSITQNRVTLIDTLGEGMELRLKNGKLDIADENGSTTGNYVLKEATVLPNGTLAEGAAVELSEGKNISYDPATRKMKLILPDKDKAYIFRYRTEVRADAGFGLKNTIEIEGANVVVKQIESGFTISSLEANATYKTNAWIEVTKKQTGADHVFLPGAVFTLTAEDGKTEEATTNEHGVARFSRLKAGKYVLKETAAPEGYIRANMEIRVEVIDRGVEKIVTINGEENRQINVFNEKKPTPPVNPPINPPTPPVNPPMPPLNPYDPPTTETPQNPQNPTTPPVAPVPPVSPAPTDNIPENPVPQGDINAPAPNTPEAPVLPIGPKDELISEDMVPKGNRELPKTSGIPVAVFFLFGVGAAGIGSALKKKR